MALTPLAGRHSKLALEYAWEKLRALFFTNPCIWILRIYDDHWGSKFRRNPDIRELARRARGESPYDAPVPLPRKRKRTLTNPLPDIESMQSMEYSVRYSLRRSRQRTDEQSMSALISKLPFEIRRIIYEEILAVGGRRLIHILRKRGRLGHWRCRIQDGEEMCDSQLRRCIEGWLSYNAEVRRLNQQRRLDIRTDDGLLPLILTCRLIYSEAISILYSKNIFHFYDPEDVRHFAGIILPQRLNCVQSIWLDWERDFTILNRGSTRPRWDLEELKAWCEAWAIIGRMKSLIELKVTLKSHNYDAPTEKRIRMCGSMMEIKHLRTFELIVPQDDRTDWSFAANAPFEIVRRTYL